MRQVLFVFAILGAVLSGWVPAMAATLHIAKPAGQHAMHQTAGHESGDTQGKSKQTIHPVACSACFAVEAVRLEPAKHVIRVSSRLPATMPQLVGVALLPLDPPPRS